MIKGWQGWVPQGLPLGSVPAIALETHLEKSRAGEDARVLPHPPIHSPYVHGILQHRLTDATSNAASAGWLPDTGARYINKLIFIPTLQRRSEGSEMRESLVQDRKLASGKVLTCILGGG